MRMGVVADDITGSNDIGSMFAKSGCTVHVYTHGPVKPEQDLLPMLSRPDIVILDTNSRLDPAELAYQKVFAATQLLRETGCQQFFNKTCSVFRGNIGAEFDAMLDALGLEFAVVVLGFPKNGRITMNGVHTVHGMLLEESEFRNDPIHPMKTSNLVDILAAQTRRKVTRIGASVIDQGWQRLKDEIGQKRSSYNYVILDVKDQDALKTIAWAVRDEPVLCGSSALAEELPVAWGVDGNLPDEVGLPVQNGSGILCIAGSLMPQTAAQIHHMVEKSVPEYILDTLQLFDAEERNREVCRIVDAAAAVLREGQDVVIHAPLESEAVDRARLVGSQRGISETEVARLVSAGLAEIAAQVVERNGQNRLVAAGGETSAAVCRRLGVRGLMIWKEIQPGLPSCLSLGDPSLLMVLKSGSFGSVDFLRQAVEHLKKR